MTSNPEISIIVPVYNVADYLGECLDSILRQDFKDWECILIDDGSTDGGGAICDEYARRDPRFVVIHQPNAGLSAARNAGMKIARGSYLSFVDSDDWVAPDFLSTLRKLLIDYQADISQINYLKAYPDKQTPAKTVGKTTELEGDRILIELLRNRELPSYVWMKLFRREVATSEFPVGVNFEDVETMTRWFANVRKVVLSPHACYFYRYRQSSIMHSNYWKNQLDYFNNMLIRFDLIHRHIPKAFSREQQWKHAAMAGMSAAKSIARFEADPDKRLEAIRQIRQKLTAVPVSEIKGLSLKKRLRLKLLMGNPAFYSRYIRAVMKFECNFYKNRKKSSFE